MCVCVWGGGGGGKREKGQEGRAAVTERNDLQLVTYRSSDAPRLYSRWVGK